MFLYESNLIEEIENIEYDSILKQIIQKNEIWSVWAWRYVKLHADLKAPLSTKWILKIHKRIIDEQVKFGHLTPIPTEYWHTFKPLPLKYRWQLRDCMVSIGFRNISAPSLGDFEELIDKLNKSIKQLENREHNFDDILELATVHHLKFETMHPFADWNGRLWRILVNYIFAYFGYPPLVIFSVFKQNYYKWFEDFTISWEKNILTMKKYFAESYLISSQKTTVDLNKMFWMKLI